VEDSRTRGLSGSRHRTSLAQTTLILGVCYIIVQIWGYLPFVWSLPNQSQMLELFGAHYSKRSRNFRVLSSGAHRVTLYATESDTPLSCGENSTSGQVGGMSVDTLPAFIYLCRCLQLQCNLTEQPGTAIARIGSLHMHDASKYYLLYQMTGYLLYPLLCSKSFRSMHSTII
jgi:hypothetical protein